MPEHLSEQDIQRYHSRGLSPSERLRLSDHIAQCAVCRRKTRASDPRPFDVAAFRAERRVPAQDTLPGETRSVPPAWRERLLAPRVLVPALGMALLLVIALAVQNVSLRREYAASARRADLVGGQGYTAIALRNGRPRTIGMAVTPHSSSGQNVGISPVPFKDTATGSKPTRGESGTNANGDHRIVGALPADAATDSRPALSQPHARTPQYAPVSAGRRIARTTPQTIPRHTPRSATVRLPEATGQPAVVQPPDDAASSFANVTLDPGPSSKDFPADRIAMVTLSPDERRLLAPADDTTLRGGVNVNSGEQPGAVEIIRPTGPMIIASPGEMRWKAVEGAAFYKVYLSEALRLDAGLVGNKALDWFKEEQSVTDTIFPLHHPLAPGKVYQWDVAAYADKEASSLLARSSLRFLVLDKKRAKMLQDIAESQFACGQFLEQTHQWERAANLYRAIDPAAAETFDKAQRRLTELAQKRPVRP